MITEKQKCIAEQSVYEDLYVMCKDNKGNDIARRVSMDSLALNGDMPLIIIAKQNYLAHHPILRPLSDLTKEITHKGYNNDEPFVPLVELAKKQWPTFKWRLKNNRA